MSESRSGIRMQFEKLLQQPADAPNLLLQGAVCGPAEHAKLLREVLGLANAAGKGQRHILFGVSREDDCFSYLQLSDGDLRVLESYPDLVARYIEPTLAVEALIGTAHGHLVAALSINSCDDPPYIIKMDASRDLRRGDCWVREGGVCRPAQRADFDRMYRSTAERRPVTSNRIVQLGFGTDPMQQSLALALPERQNPPSAQAAARMKKQIEARRAARNVNLEDTGLARLVHARLYGNEQPFEAHGLDTLVQGYNAVLEDHVDHDNYYHFETQAVKLNFSMVNTGQTPLENVRLMLSLPWAETFRVADRLYGPPGKPVTKKESELLGYPSVQRYQTVVQVKNAYVSLEPDVVTPVFEQALRIAVGPELAGKKVAMRYAIQATGLARPEEGTLKVAFKPVGR
jgi:hypothetical protein